MYNILPSGNKHCIREAQRGTLITSSPAGVTWIWQPGQQQPFKPAAMATYGVSYVHKQHCCRGHTQQKLPFSIVSVLNVTSGAVCLTVTGTTNERRSCHTTTAVLVTPPLRGRSP
jgi:hypothetical protein